MQDISVLNDARDAEAGWIGGLRQHRSGQFAHATQYQCGEVTLLSGQCSESLLCTNGSALYFNGTIFNKQELAPLVSRPLYEYSHDAALVHSLILEQGVDAILRLNGRFIILYCDREAQQIYLINDSVNSQQVFYHLTDDALIFASDIALLQANAACRKQETGIVALRDNACFSLR